MCHVVRSCSVNAGACCVAGFFGDWLSAGAADVPAEGASSGVKIGAFFFVSR
jgi:hypothetical protein